MITLFQSLVVRMVKCGQIIQQKFITLTKPATELPLPGAVMDLTKSKPDLIAENALLRQQLLVLNRQIKHPQFKPRDRFLLVILASLVLDWKQVLLILKPDTLLGWHHQGFRLLWKFKSKSKSRKPRIDADTIALIKQMTSENPLWGAERIRGELLKLEIRVAKRTIQNICGKPSLLVHPVKTGELSLRTTVTRSGHVVTCP